MIVLIAQSSNVVDIAAKTGSISPIATIGRMVEIGAGAILVVGSLGFLLYLLLGGLNWILAGGDKGKIETARGMITQGIIGLAILASVFAFYGVILRWLGIGGVTIGNYGAGSGNSRVISGGGNGSGCVVGQEVSDGGSGGYCTNGGAAMVKCYGPGQGVSRFNYNHYEPCSCISGNKVAGYIFNCSL